jgi:hypothetical protein
VDAKLSTSVYGIPLAFTGSVRPKRSRACSYVVTIDSVLGDTELQNLAAYLSTLGPAGCEVIVLDDARPEEFAERSRIFRWVGRHLPFTPSDALREAVEVASTEKIIVARADTRYMPEAIAAICDLLDHCDSVEPEEFVEPLPWWGGIDAGRILFQRGIDQPALPSTFAFRRGCETIDRRTAYDVFVRREPPPLVTWLRTRVDEPHGIGLFLAILPLLLVMTLLGGGDLAAGYAGVVMFAATAIAIRGRVGAGKHFPLHACLFAPLWLLERSITGYWTLFQRLRGGGTQAVADAMPSRVDSEVAER